MLDRKDINLKMLYCGYWSTVLRDMPFSLIQFPIWEYLKKNWSLHVNREILPIESAICGAIAGLKLYYSSRILFNIYDIFNFEIFSFLCESIILVFITSNGVVAVAEIPPGY